MFNLALLFLLQDAPDPAAIRHMAMGILAILPIIILVALAIVIIPFWFICKKAGFSPWLSLLNVDSAGQPCSDLRACLLGLEGDAGAPGDMAAQPPYPPQPPMPPQG